mmetsp:Transcript_6726/g.19673  ORF Transcript_6726/g.19673 Transcript_6726/m.19673 type:complete len:240 (-) Transcript_6726:5707-6426(-)
MSELFITCTVPFSGIRWAVGLVSTLVWVSAASDDTLAPGKAIFRASGTLSLATVQINRAGICDAINADFMVSPPRDDSIMARLRVNLPISEPCRQVRGRASSRTLRCESTMPIADAVDSAPLPKSSRAWNVPSRPHGSGCVGVPMAWICSSHPALQRFKFSSCADSRRADLTAPVKMSIAASLELASGQSITYVLNQLALTACVRSAKLRNKPVAQPWSFSSVSVIIRTHLSNATLSAE